MHSFAEEVWKMPGGIVIGLVSLLLIGLILPAATVSGDNGANWSKIHDIVDSTLNYIAKNHPDAASTVSDGGIYSLVAAPARDCIDGFKYRSGGWLVTICSAEATPDTFNITAVHDSPSIVWAGIIKKGKVTEIDYSNPSLKR